MDCPDPQYAADASTDRWLRFMERTARPQRLCVDFGSTGRLLRVGNAELVVQVLAATLDELDMHAAVMTGEGPGAHLHVHQCISG